MTDEEKIYNELLFIANQLPANNRLRIQSAVKELLGVLKKYKGEGIAAFALLGARLTVLDELPKNIEEIAASIEISS